MTFPFIRIRNCNCWCNNYSSTFCETDLVCIFAVSWTNQLENGTFIQLSILYSMIRPITIWFSFRMDYFHSSLFLDTFRFCISIHPFLPLFVAPPCGPACLVAIVLHFPSYSRLFLERFSLLHHPTLGPSTAQDSFFLVPWKFDRRSSFCVIVARYGFVWSEVWSNLWSLWRERGGCMWFARKSLAISSDRDTAQ